jgi:hypothetical protein
MKTLLTTLTLAILLAPFASAAKPAGKAMKSSGTVVSATDTNLVVTSGKAKKQITYLLNAETQKPDTLAPGSKVTIEYKMNGKERVATMIQEATGGAAPVAASTSSGTKKHKATQ